MEMPSFASPRRFSQKKVEGTSDKLDHDDDTIVDDSFHIPSPEPLEEDMEGNIPKTNMPSFSTIGLSVKKPNITKSHNFFFENDEFEFPPPNRALQEQPNIDPNDTFDAEEGVIHIKETISSSVENRQQYPRTVRVRADSYVLEQEQVGMHIEIIREWIQSVHTASLLLNSTQRASGLNVIFDSLHSKRHIPMDVGVTYELENSLQCLTSYIKDRFYDDEEDFRFLVENVAKIPKLVMTIILIEDDTDRERILNYQIMKWAIMNKHSCQVENCHKRSWLIDLIESGKRPLRKKVIEYLELISTMTAKDLLPNENSLTDKNLDSFKSRAIFKHMANFHEYREELFSVFLYMSHFIPTLLLLPDDQLEDVAGIGIIKYVTEWNLHRPIGVSVVFLDILSHIVIILSMNFISQMWTKDGDEWITVDTESVANRLLFSFATLGVVYWFFRRVSEAISLISISRMTYLKHIFNFWNLLDQILLWATLYIYIITSMITVFGVDTYASCPNLYMWLDKYWFALLSITVGLLWLNLLGLIKVLNRKFATLILAISRIMRDTMLFLVVVAISILASGDMLYIYVSNNYEVCPENNPATTNSTQAENTSVFCGNRVESYLAIYNMYIGDFDYGDFDGARLTKLVYIGMTFFGIVILLNVIIAIVCSSYEESNEQSEKLFRRARVSFVAASIAFEDLVNPNTARGYSWRAILLSLRGWAYTFVRFLTFTLALLALFIVAITYISVVDGLHRNKGEEISAQIYIIAAVFMAPSFLVWLIFCSYLITGWEASNEGHRILRTFQKNIFYRYFIFYPAMYVTRMLLGTSKFSKTNELYEAKKQGLLEPATSQNEYPNAGKIIAETEDLINTKFSIMEEHQKSNQDEIREIKQELKEIKEMISRAFKT